MSVKVENLEKNMARLTVEITAEDFEKAVEKTYQKQKGDIAIPGFRKGKVPRKIIEKMYGKEVFFEDAVNDLIKETFPKAAEESELKILTSPEITVEKVDAAEGVVYYGDVAVYPEVTLGEYKGLEVPVQNTEVTDEEINAEVKKEQEKNSRLVSVDEKEAENGDTVTIDYLGTIDGTAFDGGTANGYDLVLGSNSFIPGFEDQLIGVKAGEEKDVVVTFPEDYHADDLAGKEANFHCTVHAVKVKEIPEVDDDFVQDVSEFDTVDEYKADIKAKLAEKKASDAKTAKTNAAVEKAVANATIELPDQLIIQEAGNLMERFAQNIQAQGIELEQYLAYMGTTPEQFAEQFKPQAEAQIRTQFVLEKIADLENVEVSDEKYAESLEQTAQMYGLELDKFKELINEDYEKQLRDDLRLELAAAVIGDSAVETEAATKEAEDAMKAEAVEALKEAVKEPEAE